jgi:ABC-type amino acid transport substrate-binding protein
MAFVKRRFLSNRLFDRILTFALPIRFAVSKWIPGVFLCVCAAHVSTVSAESVGEFGERVSAPTPVTFAIPDVWPWAYEDRNGNSQGSLVQVVRRLSELTGIPTETRLRPLRRAQLDLKAGKVNFSLLFKSPALDAQAINIAEVMTIDIMLAAHADTDYPLTLEALEGKRIGFIRGTYLGEAFDQNDKVEKAPVAVISQGIAMLPLGRLSAILASDHAILRSLQAMGLDRDVLRYNKHVSGQPGALYMSRKAARPEVAEKFSEAIARMVESDELNRIFFGDAGRPGRDDNRQPSTQ